MKPEALEVYALIERLHRLPAEEDMYQFTMSRRERDMLQAGLLMFMAKVTAMENNHS